VLIGGLNFQWMCALMFLAGEKFCDKHWDLVIIHIVIVVIVSILSPVLPYMLKEVNKELYLAGLIFFAVEYCMLFGFYQYGCRSLYKTPIQR
jgi:surface polysaccharide O-acyltransferase-like enzyme